MKQTRLVVPERVRWAVELVDPAPGACILEIGCGPGAAAELICGRLTTGTLLAVDRSALAVERTRQRNQAFIDLGRLEVRQASLADLQVDEAAYDLVFAVDVNLFWTGSAAAELALLHRALVPGGRLALLWGPGPDAAAQRRSLARVEQAVAASGFVGVQRVEADRGSGVVARR